MGPIGSSLESSGGLSALQPLGSQLLGLAGGAANSSIQVLLMALLALLLCLDPQHHINLLIAATPAFIARNASCCCINAVMPSAVG